jgi:diguanylate cyclase (GGDEF)-like protein
LVDWSPLLDAGVVAVLAYAFASVSRRNRAPLSDLWLIGWIMIVLHFAAFVFLPAPGIWGTLAYFIGLAALAWAGLLFLWATVPYRQQPLSRLMFVSLMVLSTIYIGLIAASPSLDGALTQVAALIGVFPLILTLLSLRQFSHPLRWVSVGLCLFLSAVLLLFQHVPGGVGIALAKNALLFTVYLGCTIYFWEYCHRATAGSIITIAGFLAWALVFIVSPFMKIFMPQIQVESEVWNLPLYFVAVGMILLLFENQVERSIYLSLHDELTGLPNRRLFQDRLIGALERARRTSSQTALMVIDLDHFKRVNDTLGHHTGDLLLQHVASVFMGRLRRTDTVARTGGDEFSLILESPVSRVNADKIGQELLQLLKKDLQLEDHTVQIGASFGVAIFPDDAQSMESLCSAADLRMYGEKQETPGHNRPGDSSSTAMSRS